MNSHCQNKAGFTLLEVLICMAVLVFMSLGIYQATTETYRLRDILSAEGDFYNGIRMAMDIMQLDVSLLYSPTLMIAPSPTPSPAPGTAPGAPPAQQPNPVPDKDMQQILAGDLGQTTDFYGPAIDKNGIRPTRFLGSDSKVSFVSASNIRIYKNAPESMFVKVTYSLAKDEGNQAVPEAMMLVKTESTDAFDDDSRRDATFKRTLPLLHGITQLKIQYCQKDKDPCNNSWDSDLTDYKNIYPDFIKVNLIVKGRLKLYFEGTYIFRPEVPLRGIDPSS